MSHAKRLQTVTIPLDLPDKGHNRKIKSPFKFKCRSIGCSIDSIVLSVIIGNHNTGTLGDSSEPWVLHEGARNNLQNERSNFYQT